jgi:hypothetical protein
VRNAETRSGSAPPLAAWQAGRKGGGIPGRERMPKKRMPVAERQQENEAQDRLPPPVVSYNWPDTRALCRDAKAC